MFPIHSANLTTSQVHTSRGHSSSLYCSDGCLILSRMKWISTPRNVFSVGPGTNIFSQPDTSNKTPRSTRSNTNSLPAAQVLPAPSELSAGPCSALPGAQPLPYRGTTSPQPLFACCSNMDLLTTSHFSSPRKTWTSLQYVLRAIESKTPPSLLLITVIALLPYCHPL